MGRGYSSLDHSRKIHCILTDTVFRGTFSVNHLIWALDDKLHEAEVAIEEQAEEGDIGSL